MIGESRKTIISFQWIVVLVMMLTSSGFGQRTNSSSCPSSIAISPCNCRKFVSNNGRWYGEGITIDCESKNLSDSQIGRVLENFFAPGISPVIEILAPFNKLTKIPRQISKFPVLARLNLDSNQISELLLEDDKPLLNSCLTNRNAMYISLSNNQITRIPSGVFHFSYASDVELFLTDNKITTIAPGAFRFLCPWSVIWIHLSRNQLNYLPAGVFTSPEIKSINVNLDYNQFGVIPSAAFNFPLVKDVSVSISWNKISSIGLNAFNFTSSATLVDIDLSRNSITTIPCGSFFSFSDSRVTLGLSYNQITSIPSCAFLFPSSKSVNIYLDHNLIKTISPGAFNFPSAIIMLNLYNNQISVIPPDTFDQGRYELLSVAKNQLKRLESTFYKPLSKPLNWVVPPLSISENPIDCSADPCHLAWLLQNPNRSQLLRLINADNICSNYNRSPFSTLNSFDFSKNCACSYN